MKKDKIVHKRPNRIIKVPNEVYFALKAFAYQYSVEVDEFITDLLSELALQHHNNIMKSLPKQKDLISNVVNGVYTHYQGKYGGYTPFSGKKMRCNKND